MSILLTTYLLFSFTTLTCKGAFTNFNNGYQGFATVQNNNGIITVSSTASHTSNDQIASIRDDKYQTPVITIRKGGDTMTYTYPLNNRGIAAGSIQMKPGSIAVSSSYTNTPTYWPNIPTFDPIFPMFKNLYPRINFYQPPKIEPWFTRTMMYGLDPLKPVVRNPFMHQNLDLLNPWQ